MPIRIPHTHDEKEYKTGKFADINTLVSFPKTLVTSKMIPISDGDKEAFLVSCIGNQPLSVVKDAKIYLLDYEKNDLIPMKPIQNLKSFAEHSGCIVLAHGDHNLEFGKIFQSTNEQYKISRFCQRSVDETFKKILFNSNTSFTGASNSQLELYDFNRITRLCSIRSKSDILDFDLCPFDPFILAYSNGCLNVIDAREASSITSKSLYKQENRSDFIRWNPIVPYWLATTTQDKIQIFDIRYNSPSPAVTIEHSNVNELCWSPNNCDLILAASKDRRINLWSLRNSQDEESRLSMIMNRFELNSLCSKSSVSSSGSLFYGLDDMDSIVKIKINPNFLSSIAPHSNLEPEHRDIEGALYSADLKYFKEKLTILSKEALETKNYAKLKQLIMLTMPMKMDILDKFNEKIISSIEMNSKSDFDQLLQQGTSLNHLTFKNSREECSTNALQDDREIQNFVDQLRLKVRVVELLAAGDYSTLKNFQSALIESFISDCEFLDREHSIKLVAFIFKNDRKEGLNFVQSISSSFTVGTPEIIQIWHWIAFYPTIFDAKSFELIKSRPSLSRSIGDLNEHNSLDDGEFIEKLRNQNYSALLLNPQTGPQTLKLVQQLHLNIGTSPRTLRNLVNLEEKMCDMDQETIELTRQNLLEDDDSNINLTIISAELIKRILESSLKSTNLLSEFFKIAFRLQLLTEKTPIYGAIRDLVTVVGMARLKLQVGQAKLVQTPQESVKRTLKTILSIGTDPYCNLSEDQMEYLTEQLSTLQEIYDFEDLTDSLIEGNHIGFNIQIQIIKNKLASRTFS